MVSIPSGTNRRRRKDGGEDLKNQISNLSGKQVLMCRLVFALKMLPSLVPAGGAESTLPVHQRIHLSLWSQWTEGHLGLTATGVVRPVF